MTGLHVHRAMGAGLVSQVQPLINYPFTGYQVGRISVHPEQLAPVAVCAISSTRLV